MINKEIEVLLNDIKKQLTIDEKLGKGIAQDFHKTTLNYEKTKLLLSYIEQLEKRNQKLKKQKDDVVEYIKKNKLFKYVYDEEELFEIVTDKQAKNDLLRMLGEIDENN